MRDLERNKRVIYYSSQLSEEETDEYGNTTKKYSLPLSYKISVSSGTSASSGDTFGRDIVYDREMRTHDMNCPISEFSHIWIECSPEEIYDYIVVAKVTSLNVVKYAIKRVDVSEN